uniref:MFS domain-containing protein n=1 Tax=Ascaris lumbricoides TaxID=6252 RepID=A0A0M3HKB1_ASCLU
MKDTVKLSGSFLCKKYAYSFRILQVTTSTFSGQCFAQSIVLGSFVGGHCGDHFGRRKFFFTGQLCIIITSVMATATVSWYTYAICLSLNTILYGMIEVGSLSA